MAETVSLKIQLFWENIQYSIMYTSIANKILGMTIYSQEQMT